MMLFILRIFGLLKGSLRKKKEKEEECFSEMFTISVNSGELHGTLEIIGCNLAVTDLQGVYLKFLSMAEYTYFSKLSHLAF